MNTIGTLFKVSIFGESHGQVVGVLVDGVPAGISLTEEDFYHDIEMRKPKKKGTTPRKEADIPHIMSGVFNGYTTGSAILITFNNENINDNDYSNLVTQPRPGHADYTGHIKYDGFNDYRGGGAFSGRLTLAIVAAGVIAKKILPFEFNSRIKSLKGEKDITKFEQIVEEAMKNRNSVGGTIEVTVKNMIQGLGEPYFDSVESRLSHILYSIGAVKGVSFGVGFDGESLYGSEYNDLIIDKEGHTKTNNNGGINGGITNGNDLIVNVFVKPTPSISLPQETFNFKTGKVETLEIKGRHDACIALRAPIVIENAIAIALCDLYLIKKAYKK
jgi:chorismate synthase